MAALGTMLISLPLAGQAQPAAKMPHIGYLNVGSTRAAKQATRTIPVVSSIARRRASDPVAVAECVRIE